MNAPWVLGISASHNGSAALLRGNRVVVAIQEERLVRHKYARIHAAQPAKCIAYCLSAAGITSRDLDAIAVAVQGSATDQEHDVRTNPLLRLSNHAEVFVVGHHVAHALSAFALSGFRTATAVVIDGLGSHAVDLEDAEQKLLKGDVTRAWETASIFAVDNRTVQPIWKQSVVDRMWLMERRAGLMPFFGSVGGMYAAAATRIFGDPLDAGKVMGLAPYGKPSIAPNNFYRWSDNNLRFLEAVPQGFPAGKPWPEKQHDLENLASSVQSALEAVLNDVFQFAVGVADNRTIVYSGGVALNSVANHRLLTTKVVDRLFIPPAAEDSGPAIGAAFAAMRRLGVPPVSRRLQRDATGRSYTSAEVSRAIQESPSIVAVKSEVADVAKAVSQGEIFGWFSGGSELGPRALGNRSIICDPRRQDAKETLNARVKFREAFRPFAPAVTLSNAGDWFDFEGTECEEPFMLRVVKVREEKRPLIPGVVHVDGTARLQTVRPGSDFYKLIAEFEALTGIPVLINTSYNVMGEPIVETPRDAIDALLQTGLDGCWLEGWLLRKNPTTLDPLDLFPLNTSRIIQKVENADRSRHFKISTHTQHGESILEISPLAQLMLSMCDGRHRVREIFIEVSGLAAEFNRPALDEEGFRRAVRSLHQNGCITYVSRLSGE